jgi:hypothetical protein
MQVPAVICQAELLVFLASRELLLTAWSVSVHRAMCNRHAVSNNFHSELYLIATTPLSIIGL